MLNKLQGKLDTLTSQNLIREKTVNQGRHGKMIMIKEQPYIDLSSNDYLGISQDVRATKAYIEALSNYGIGSVSSPVISGYSSLHQTLEEEFCQFLERDQAILFNSGYHANIGILSTLASDETKVVMDRLCHASIIDGVKLSRAKLFRYQHNNAAHAAKLLLKHSPSIIITESIFSMEGDIAPVPEFLTTTKSSNATLIIDDAHAIGVLGDNGGGICEYYHLSQYDVPLLVVPLGKALGSMGAIVAGNSKMIEYLRQSARSYIYSTALPPAVVASTIMSLDILRQEHWRRDKLFHLINLFIFTAKKLGLPLCSEALTPIKSIIVGCNKTTLQLQQKLKQHGYFISCIRPPTVPQGTSRIRISLNIFHDDIDIINLLNLIALNLH